MSAKRELSANLRQMKFMQRQQENELREKLRQEQEKAIAESHWSIKSSTGVVYAEETSSTFVSANTCGRRSFGNFNASIEKLNERKTRRAEREQRREQRRASKKADLVTVAKEESADVSAEELARKAQRNQHSREGSEGRKKSRIRSGKRRREANQPEAAKKRR